jgi:hypothetical protein
MWLMITTMGLMHWMSFIFGDTPHVVKQIAKFVIAFLASSNVHRIDYKLIGPQTLLQNVSPCSLYQWITTSPLGPIHYNQ